MHSYRLCRHPFNPSLVRLAHHMGLLGVQREEPFNPSLVRLALGQGFEFLLARLAFQSQLGSIGAREATPPPRASAQLSIPAWFDWRHGMTNPRLANNTTFNPSLVRLAPQCLLLLRPILYRFQSQLGSIGAVTAATSRTMSGAGFQSQLGSIGALHEPGRVKLVRIFQSQLGSIGARSVLDSIRWGLQLSIPAWFDWRHQGSHQPVGKPLPFNPSLVRLARCSRCRSASWWSAFNPSLVRLAPREATPPPRASAHFQSQLGSIGAGRPAPRLSLHHPFNPSLVRLALGERSPRDKRYATFNPSLVRLAPGTPVMPAPPGYIFQSQLGSIGAGHIQFRKGDYFTLSIPAWFDWRPP